MKWDMVKSERGIVYGQKAKDIEVVNSDVLFFKCNKIFNGN